MLNPVRRQRFAVIGSGISGLSAAWLLGHAHDVVVYEREARPGGHSNTVRVDGANGAVDVDTGFIVYNEWTYPNLCALFDHLGVATQSSDMSFAVSADHGKFEYSGRSFAGLFGQPSNIARPRFWRMLRDIRRFYGQAPALLAKGALNGLSLGDVLKQGRYSDDFQRDHLLPMAAAIWSGTVEGMREYPASAFVRFFVNHGLLNYLERPIWRTVTGGSRQYVDKISASLNMRTNTGVAKIMRHDKGVIVRDLSGHEDRFDGVVMATHADITLSLLDDPSDAERNILSPFGYQRNTAVLHADQNLMPRRKRMWSSWNYIADPSEGGDASICVSYWMNLLQDLDPAQPLFVTLNPIRAIDDRKTFASFDYDHPLFDTHTEVAQKSLWQLQGQNNTWFCGSYFGAGFHEDGLQSGLAAAEAAGDVRRPWTVENESARIHLAPNESVAA